MSFLSRFRDAFSTSSCDHNSTINSNINQNLINPSSGLPITGSIDIAGNAYGSNSHDIYQSTVSHDHYNGNFNGMNNTMHQSYDYYNNSFSNPFNNY